MSSFPATIEKLRFATSVAKSNDITSARAVYRAIYDVFRAIPESTDSELVASSALTVLEDIFSNRNIVISKGLQTVINSVYVDILKTTPGYAVRNVVTSLLSIIGHKTLPTSSKECAVMVIGNVMEKRSFDLGSLMSEVVASMAKLLKGSDTILRIASLTALKCICDGGGALLGDCHPDILRTAGKLISDRSPDVRGGIANLVAALAVNSSGCSSVSAEALFGVALKGLEDESAIVQEKFSYAVACVYNELIQAFVAEQEKAKVGIARGGGSDADKSGAGKDGGRRGSLLKLKELSAVKDMLSSGLGKKNSEEFDFRSVIKSLIKQTVRSSSCHVRAAFILVIQFLVEMVFSFLDHADLEWVASALVSSLADQSVVTMSYEEIVYFRSRLCHLLRCISSQMLELNQLKMVSHLCTILIVDGLQRTEHEIQLVFSALGQLVAALGEASAASVASVYEVTTVHLRHSSFGVRASAAHVLVALATVVPALASGYFAGALAAAKEQVTVLLKGDATSSYVDNEADSKYPLSVTDPSPSDVALDVTLSSGGGHESPVSDGGARLARKSPKDLQRLKTMFNFHGQILLISTFLKQEKNISTGLPKVLVLDAFDFGLDMLVLEIVSVDATVRHVVCSIIRAGSLVISSCLNMGYRMVNSKISKLLSNCSDILFATTNDRNDSSPGTEIGQSGTSTPTNSSPDLLYELMSVEAALVCISALLWFCPESLVFNEHYMELVVDGLDIAFHAIKGKYQSKFRTHFRFRTLHVILLECYSWLPHGSFPSTCQQLFVEGLRTFRDSISSGYECTGLPNCILGEHRVLSISNTTKGNIVSSEYPYTENQLMLRLEQHAVALQKKESEAFLASFTKETGIRNSGSLYSNDWNEPLSPCAFIDSRAVDAAISLVGATFSSQSVEFQGKAIELCSQILVQVQKSANSVGLFTSDEERKRRDRHALLSTRNTVTLLYNIVESFPADDGAIQNTSSRNWVSGVSEKLFELLTSATSADIRSAAVNALCKLCSKTVGQHLVESVAIRIIQCIKSCTDKKGEGADASSGYAIALSSLWSVSSEKPTLQAAMSTIIFDTLKRYEYSPLFRGSVIFALSYIVRSKTVGQGSNDVQETLSLIGRVCDAAEDHLLCGSGNGNADGFALSGDYDFLLVCLQRLINATVSIMMEIDPTSHLMYRLFQLWEIIRMSSSHIFVERECIEFVVGASMFPTDALPFQTTSLYLQKILLRRADINGETLQTAIAALRALMIRNSRVVCDVGIDINLFKLLDWTVAASYPLCTAPYWGLELRSGLGGVVDSSQSLQRSIELALDALVGIDAQQHPQDASVRWILLCRSIALGAAGSALQQKDDGLAPDVNTREADSTIEEKEPISVFKETAPLQCQQFAAWKREQGALKASALSSARCRLRCVALHCSTAAFIGAGSRKAHYDLQLCREETQNALNLLPPNVNDDILRTVPSYLSLFLQDIVNMACACASFTIEDNKQTALQAEAIDFLYVIVSAFSSSFDPDFIRSGGVDATDEKSSMLLELYMAQIVSAIRPCLSARWYPALLLTSGGLICELLRGGLLKDRAVLRRLLKALTGNCDLDQESPILVPVTDEVAEEIATINHVVNLTNLSRVYVLGQDTGVGQKISPNIKGVILSTISQSISQLHSAWEALSFDGARLLQGHKKWPKPISETDPRRGGATYSSMTDISRVRSYYEYSLPFVTVASVLSSEAETSLASLPVEFFILESILENLAALPNSQFEHKLFIRASSIAAQTGGLARLSRSFIEPLVYCGIASICKKLCHEKCADVKLRSHQTQELVRLLLFLCREIIPHRAASAVNFSDFVSMSADIGSLLASIVPFLKDASLSAQVDIWSWSWITALSLLGIFFSDLFESTSILSSYGDDLEVKISRVLFPSVLPCPMASQPAESERFSVVLSSGLIQKLLGIIVDLAQYRLYEENGKFVPALHLAILGRLSFLADSTNVNAARKLIAASLLQWSRNSKLGSSGLPDVHKPITSDIVLNNLTPWLLFYVQNSDALQQMGLSGTHRLADVVDSIISVWVSSGRDEDVTDIMEPWSLAAIVLMDQKVHALICFQVELLQLLQKYFSLLSGSARQFVSSCIFPAAVLRLITLDVVVFQDLACCLAGFLFFVVKNAPSEECKSTQLRIMLSPLCSSFGPCEQESAFLLSCGERLTDVAKSNPDLFKSQVVTLSDTNRSVLQNAMRLAIMKQQGQTHHGGAGGLIGGQAKKIDLSRYRK